MKYLMIALYLAAGTTSFIRCGVENISCSDGTDASVAEKSRKGESWETIKTDDTSKDSDDSIIDGKVRQIKRSRGGQKLRFGIKGRFVANKSDVLGKGGFGKVYKALDTKTGRKVAVKTELKNAKKGSLLTESKNYKIIGRHNGIPRILFSGKSSDGKSRVLVMQMLGKSLETLQNERPGRKFSPKTVYMIGIQLLRRIEMLHRRHLVHCDIKPGNMGIAKSKQLIYLFDFGQSRRYADDTGRKFPEGRSGEYGIGDMRYMSVYAHKHKKVSRRDDLWSIGFVMMSFLRGNLPWYNAHGYEEPASKSNVVRMKENLNLDKFCKGSARPMLPYFKHLQNDLKFNSRPKYSYLRGLFQAALSAIGETDNKLFDWRIKH